MSSFSFSLENDPVLAVRPSSSLEEGNVFEEDEAVTLSRVWKSTNRQSVFLHRKIAFEQDYMSQEMMTGYIQEHPVDRENVALCRVQVQVGMKMRARLIRLELILQSYIHGDVNYIHEMLPANAPCKPFLDVDCHEYLSPEQALTFRRQLVMECSRKLGWPSDLSQWRFLECPYPPEKNKFSLHVVLCSNYHYSCPSAQLEHMIQNRVDLDRFHIDVNIYKSSSYSSLRMIGGSKWENDALPIPFILLGTPNPTMTMETLKQCLIQYVPETSHEISVDLPEGRPDFIVSLDVVQGLSDPRIEQAIEYFRSISEDPTASMEVSSISYHHQMNRISFALDDHSFCEHSLKCAIDYKLHTVQYNCSDPSGRCDYIATHIEGYTQRSARYMLQKEYLDWLLIHNLCRLDFPLWCSSDIDNNLTTFGHYGFTKETYFVLLHKNMKLRKLLCEDVSCKWCRGRDMVPSCYVEFYAPAASTRLFDVDFFDWIRDRIPAIEIKGSRTEALLCAYMALFIGENRMTGSTIIRGKGGLTDISAKSLREVYCGDLTYREEKIIKKGRGREAREESVWVTKPFFPLFLLKNRHSYEQVNDGGYDVWPGSPLNIRDPIDVNVGECYEKWQVLSKPDKECLQNVWKRYLSMMTWSEDKALQEPIRKQLERWVMEVALKSGVPTYVVVVLVSAGGGQGKSTLGNLLCAILGPKNSITKRPEQALGKFNEGNNGFNFFDEVTFNSKSVVEAFKSAVTAPRFSKEGKMKKAVEVPNMRNFLVTSNSPKNLTFINSTKERRSLVLFLPEMSFLSEHKQLKYVCGHCDQRACEWGRCEHMIDNHDDLMTWFYTYILGQTPSGSVKGTFFDEFVGMLYETMLDEMIAGNWDQSLQRTLITTGATAELQIETDTIVAKYIDNCAAHGHHWSPYIPPSKVGVSIVHREVDIPRLVNEQEPTWEEFVPVDALYEHFKQWCVQDSNRPCPRQEFLTDLESISKSRRNGISMKPVLIEPGRTLKWLQAYQTDRPTWVPQTSVASNVSVLNMGTIDQWSRKQKVGINAIVKAKKHDNSQVLPRKRVVEEVQSDEEEEDDSFGAFEEREAEEAEEYADLQEAEEYVDLHESTNQFATRVTATARSRKDRETAIIIAAKNAAGLNDDDAMDIDYEEQELTRFRRLATFQSDEDVDEEEQDRRAAVADSKAKSNRKRVSGWFAEEAIEDNEDEEPVKRRK